MTCFTPHRFGRASQERIDIINRIIREYQATGYTLTVRQLYYQLVSRDYVANNVQEYKRLVDLVSQGRLAGLIDWSAIEDRTRNLSAPAHWDDVPGIIDAAASSFQLDLWRLQKTRPELWIEKEALAGVFSRVSRTLRVGYFSCRGYVSQSEMHDAAQRFRRRARNGQRSVILHFGDHDPSGIDMTRDIVERMGMFGANVEVKRLALNMNQVHEHEPPANPAKTTDARFAGYQELYGDESWELDALPPNALADLATEAIDRLIDREAWGQIEQHEREGRALLRTASDRWPEVVGLLRP